MNLSRFPEKAWAGIEILIVSEVPEYGEKLAERISGLAPEQELRLHVFSKYIEAHDRAKKTKNLGVVLLIEGESGNLPLHDVMRELLVPYESRGIPGAALLFSEKELTVRGALSAKKTTACLDYLPFSRTESSDALLKILMNLYQFKQTRFEEKLFPSSTQDLLQNIRGASDEELQFETRVNDLLTSKLNLSWMESIKARFGATLFSIHLKNPEVLRGMVYEKVIPIEKIADFSQRSNLHSAIEPADVPSFVSAFLWNLVEATRTDRFEETLDRMIPDQDTSAFDEPIHRVLLREKESILRLYEEYYGARRATSWRKTG